MNKNLPIGPVARTALRKYMTTLAAVVIILIAYGFASQPRLGDQESEELSNQFRFARVTLPEQTGTKSHNVRVVHRSLERISAWISAAGASVALADADGDGLANDVCLVDPRTDIVNVMPVPGTGKRFAAFLLDPQSLRFDRTMAPMGCLTGDYNEDGLTDFIVYYWGRTPIAFLQRQTSNRMHEIDAQSFHALELLEEDQRWFTNSATSADLDGDGHVDLLFANYFPDGAHILDPEDDGIEELHNTKSKAYNGGMKHFLLWRGATMGRSPQVIYSEAENILDKHLDKAWTLAVGAADLNGDLLPEIYFANDFGPDRLLYNTSTPGHLKFLSMQTKREIATPKSFVLGSDSFKGMGVDFGDLNGDGILDLFVSNIATNYGLHESHFVWLSTGTTWNTSSKMAPYVQASERLGVSRSNWGWDARIADFNNDGDPEILQATGFMKGEINRWPELQALGTGNDQMISNPQYWPSFKIGDDVSGDSRLYFFVRSANGRYSDLATQVGLDKAMVTRGIAVADVDGDGDLDFVAANQWEPSFLFRNECPRCGAFLGLHLLRVGSGGDVKQHPGHPAGNMRGVPAVGATVTVTLPDGSHLVGQVDGGTGHSGKRSPEVHFGLGQLDLRGQGLTTEVAWRDSNGQVNRQQLLLKPGWHTVSLGAPE